MVGTVSREAQRRVDKRVIEIMARRDAAARRDCRQDQARAESERSPAFRR
jgi:hypothetical protein